MSEAEVLYSDVRFTRGEETGSVPSSAADTIYSEVKVLKEPPCTESPGSQQVRERRRSKVTVKRVVLLVAGVLLIAAVVAVAVALLTKKTEKVKQGAESNNLTDVVHKQSEEHWEKHSGKFYFFSTDKLNWDDSRDKCKSKGGDLVTIKSKEEQFFLDEKLRSKMEEAEDKFWIGLTDSVREGTWLWVDNQLLLNRLKFWSGEEPDDYKGKYNENAKGEDCVRMGEKGGAENHKSWFDKDCNTPNKYICEK